MAEDKVKAIHQYECDSCGATLAFDGECGNLKCGHCGSVREVVRDRAVVERGFEELVAHAKWSASSVSCYRCDNCGATTVLNSATIATSCPYCKSPVVLDDSSIDSVRPDTAIPFNIGKSRANAELLNWRKKSFWAPKKWRTGISVDDMSSTYAPAWTFDSDTFSSYNGKVGYRRTRTVTRNGKKVTESYTEWRHVSGNIDMQFDDLMVRGNQHVAEKHFVKLMPFPQSHYVKYDDDYLAGHIADNYTVAPQDAYEAAQKTMRQAILSEIKLRHRADVMGDMNINTNYRSRSFKYVMLPVYVTATKYKSKVYPTYVSGITSGDNKVKVTGDRPISWIKVISAILIALIVIGGLLFGLDYAGVIRLEILHMYNIVDSTIACATSSTIPPTLASIV